MKKVLFIGLFVIGFISYVFSQNNNYPSYGRTEYDIVLNLARDSIFMFVDDVEHRYCDSVMHYRVFGMPPINGHRWIQTTGGTLNAQNDDIPTALLCRMLSAYSSGMVSSVTSLYATRYMSTVNELLSDTGVYNAFINAMSIFNKMDFLMSVEQDGYTIAFVDLYQGDSNYGATPYILVEDNDGWKFASPLNVNFSIVGNLLNFLNYYSASSLLGSNDFDMDGIPNNEDNCPCSYNPNQSDMDHDGIGDECDNCPITANADQFDVDNDGYGDVCDNCPRMSNPSQTDSDGDRIGDSCDNCPMVVNPRQIDFDGDTLGNECDPDIDDDGILNEMDDDMDGDEVPNDWDNCPMQYNPSQYDSDDDGIGDACDCCPLMANPNQEDGDGDGVGDVCETDYDHDGIPNETDNCQHQYNPGQADLDCDGIGDECDPDIDGDGIHNERDNCPVSFNPDQADANNNGIGDVCE